jgi:hypothetical protein
MIDSSGQLHLIMKNQTSYKYTIYNKNNVPVDVDNVFANNLYLLDNLELLDLKVFDIYPNLRIVIGMKRDQGVTSFYLGINDEIFSDHVIGNSLYTEIIHLQYMNLNTYYIFLKDGANRVKMEIQDASGNFGNAFESRTVYYVDHFVKKNLLYLIGSEGSDRKLFVFMKGELLFENMIGNSDTTFGLGDLYFTDHPTNPSVLKFIKMEHEFIGIQRSDVDLIQISGTIPSYFSSKNFPQKNVYYDKITNDITTDRTKEWIGLKTFNSGFYIKY